ncbi:hypothetical protein FHS19_003350 [Paenibacillus rhizosphaerae]|uniref:DUF1330 domain-containing protein n=1 Tax=Paenibacillus rhizosphaerae TaxID=297318 RepID=A0A839TPF1_9BACL|nr:hypothetical protein [Paenibacillus rhizosphaerae]MBB3128696.1 hypothetical protein [Paenibacillus rhizosphaerae]
MNEKSIAQLYVMTANIPEEGVEKFNDYESHVLPLLNEHGAKLERRLQSPDRLIEIHIIWFPSDLGATSVSIFLLNQALRLS